MQCDIFSYCVVSLSLMLEVNGETIFNDSLQFWECIRQFTKIVYLLYEVYVL